MAVSAISGLTNADGTPQSASLQPRQMFRPGQGGGDGLVTAVSKFPGIKDSDRQLVELVTQHKIYKEGDSANQERAAMALAGKVLGSSSLSVFVGVKAGYLRLIHSAQIFMGDVHDASPHDDKIVAFVGDRREGQDPRAVTLHEEFFQ